MPRVQVLSRSWLVAESLAGLVNRWQEFEAGYLALPAGCSFQPSAVSPDVLVVDVVKASDARELIELASRTWPDVPAVFVGSDSQTSAPTSEGRTRTWLSKDIGEDGLRAALRAACQSAPIRSQHRRLDSVSNPDADSAGRQPLTPRELEILRHLAAGQDAHAIAAQLLLSPNTVRTHVQNILAKLGVHSRFEAATLALRSGLVGSPRARDPGTRPQRVLSERRVAVR